MINNWFDCKTRNDTYLYLAVLEATRSEETKMKAKRTHTHTAHTYSKLNQARACGKLIKLYLMAVHVCVLCISAAALCDIYVPENGSFASAKYVKSEVHRRQSIQIYTHWDPKWSTRLLVNLVRNSKKRPLNWLTNEFSHWRGKSADLNVRT